MCLLFSYSLLGYRQDHVRFCLSNGHSWLFFVLVQRGSGWAYHVSAPLQLGPQQLLSVDTGIRDVSRILVLVLEWVCIHFPLALCERCLQPPVGFLREAALFFG